MHIRLITESATQRQAYLTPSPNGTRRMFTGASSLRAESSIRFSGEEKPTESRWKKAFTLPLQWIQRVLFRDASDLATRKGERFITTNRYNLTKTNWKWAAAAEDLCAETSLKLKGPFVPEAVLADLAARYREVVLVNSNDWRMQGKIDDFSVPRDFVDLIPIGSYGEVDAYQKYHQTLESMFLMYSTAKDPAVDPPFFKYSFDGKDFTLIPVDPELVRKNPKFRQINRVLNYTIEIDGKPVDVMKTYCCADQSGWLGTDVKYLWYLDIPKPQVLRHIGTLMGEAAAMKELPKTPENLQKTIDKIATLHWLFSVAMPYRRGSAGIADILTKALFDHLEIETPCWRLDNSPDLEAMATPKVKDFVAIYPLLFEEPLRYKATNLVEMRPQAPAKNIAFA